MKSASILCLLPVLLAMVISQKQQVNALKCAECSLPQESCMGQEVTCTTAGDICSNHLGESTMGILKYMGIIRGCLDPTICNAGTISMTIGSAVTLRTAMECCSQDNCNSNKPTLSPANTTLNGLQCPVCYAKDSGQCESKETMRCTGSEDHCISMTGNIGVNSQAFPLPSPLAVRGCATKSACTIKKDYTVYSGLFTYVTSTLHTCTPATKVANSANRIPGPSS